MGSTAPHPPIRFWRKKNRLVVLGARRLVARRLLHLRPHVILDRGTVGRARLRAELGQDETAREMASALLIPC